MKRYLILLVSILMACGFFSAYAADQATVTKNTGTGKNSSKDAGF
ncbi:MAG TPA: hypothetical protein VHO84_01450 [Syntrophorhabdaceae bacterium]|nr:hypothetical protein [Syntrophorhabdaceae bacterium]